MKSVNVYTGSFRDPSGFVFFKDNKLYRQINKIYSENYDTLMNSGLYDELAENKLLVPHKETDKNLGRGDVYKIIAPEFIPFLSYPYEWCFSQLKDATLLTLKIQKIALAYGMSLKDCSSYNIQFLDGKPIFIDTLSFERYKEGEAWVGYRQFCQHFLAPLALMAYTDIRMNQLLKIFIDGIPLDLASSLLPFKTKLKLSLLQHIHLHAKAQKTFGEKSLNKLKTKHRFSLMSFKGLIDNLESCINKLNWKPGKSEWSDYYENTHNYASSAIEHKKGLVSKFLDKVKPKTVWDLGANTGMFSTIASGKGVFTVAFDIDHACTEMNYVKLTKNNYSNILPLVIDLTNPSPSIGWNNEERTSFINRGPADTVLALALIHHLAISNNVPLRGIASFFNKICKNLIIEFVPKNDSQVQRLLASREDIFNNYTKENFENEFSEFFKIIESEKIKDSERYLYLMKAK